MPYISVFGDNRI